MKLTSSLLIVFILLTGKCNSAYCQNKAAPQQIAQMLKEFYTAYNTAWSTNKGVSLIHKLDSLKIKYCTKKLINEVKEFGLDHDPLIGDDYTDVEHLKTLSITKDSTTAFAYTVFYIAHTLSASNEPIDEKVIIHLNVAKEGGVYKIAAVK